MFTQDEVSRRSSRDARQQRRLETQRGRALAQRELSNMFQRTSSNFLTDIQGENTVQNWLLRGYPENLKDAKLAHCRDE